MNNEVAALEPLRLWEQRKEIRDTIDEIERLTSLVTPMENQTNYLVGTAFEGEPFGDTDTDLICVSRVAKNQYLYKSSVRDSGGWGFLDHQHLVKTPGVAWVCRVNPPNWMRDIPADVLICLVNLLPIDKIFIVAGLCARFRTICFGAGLGRSSLTGGRVIWNDYLGGLGFHRVPPHFPRSMKPFFKASTLLVTHLSKWGFPMEKTMRRRGQDPATWIPLTPPTFLPCVVKDGSSYFLELKDSEDVEQFVRVMIGDNAVCLLVRATASSTSKTLLTDIIHHQNLGQKVTVSMTFHFFVQCPPPNILQTFTDQQFEQIGLELPSRDPDSHMITSLPLRDEFIPWVGETPLSFYRATVGWKILVKVYERRAFKKMDNEGMRQLIIQRFRSNKFCKHCYKEIVDKNSRKTVPPEWIEQVPGVGPICIDCFTHMFSSDITVVKGEDEDTIPCPACRRNLSPAYRNQLYYRIRECYAYYQCVSCNGPKLYVMYIKQQLRFQPHATNWTRRCLNMPPIDTEIMKKSKNAKQERYISKLKVSIKLGIEEIMRQQVILDDLGIHDYPKIQVIDDPSPPPSPTPSIQPPKRPATGLPVAGKALPPLKKPMMSPVSIRLSGKKIMSAEDYKKAEDEEEDDDWFDDDDECSS